MASHPENGLLAKLARTNTEETTDDPWAAVAATEPAHELSVTDELSTEDDEKLSSMLERIHSLTQGGSAGSQPLSAADDPDTCVGQSAFLPQEPTTLAEAGVSESVVESLLLKLLFSRGDLVGRVIADHICLPFKMIEDVLQGLKYDQLVVYRGSTAMNDYIYQLTDLGRERARRHTQHCTYFGAAPVTLQDYVTSVRAQSLERQHPSAEDLQCAFEDLLINPTMLGKLGPAINSGRGLFLFGPPGNGKSSIAERVTRAFGSMIWVPRAIGIDGEIMRVFDPMNHIEQPLEEGGGLLDESRTDRRWVRIRRPTIVVGGELVMENLEVTLNSSTGITEAPLQLKSNCGTLVIDDFGRQRMSTDELLNRWIVPLEKRIDYLNMPNGKKIQVPFDQLVIFSTNLEPRELVDDAFLRRIPYKIEVIDPCEDDFRQLFRMMCESLEIEYRGDVIDYLLATHFRAVGRAMRCCQPRDLLLQVRNQCRFEHRQPELTRESIDFAVENYFAVM